MERQLSRLKWARLAKRAPIFPPEKKTAMQRRGLAYEAKVLKALHALFNDAALVMDKPWFEFKDANGFGLCQPDALIIPHDKSEACIIIEVKLTHKPEAERKLREFYAPVIARAMKRREWKYAQLFKNATDKSGSSATSGIWQQLSHFCEYADIHFRP